MSLTTQVWKYVGTASFASGLVALALDALNTLGTAVTYADATTRTPGSGSAWTWSRYQNVGVTEAMYATPPTDTLSQRIILAGQAAAVKTPTMASPDTSAAAVILAGINKNSGAFNAWDNVAPFTSGSFSGFWRAWPGSVGAGSVYLYECQEAVIVLITTTAGGVYGILMGAFLDPESSDVAVDAESDGKLYGMSVSGVTAAMHASWWTQNSTSDWLRHSVTASQMHAAVFTPGAGTVLTFEPLVSPRTAMTASGLKSRSGRFGRQGFAARASLTAPNDQTLGRFREICVFNDAQVPSKQSNGGTTIGHVVSASTAAAADAILLLA